jgi:large subunit ribosomal protein L5
MMESTSTYSSRLRASYRDDLRFQLQKSLELANIMEVPQLKKIVVNIGVKKSVGDSKMFQLVSETVGNITGQKPLRTKARKSIANFKIRDGMDVGVSVTLRNENMYRFLEKLINLSLPRVRDFQGISTTAFDGQGNFNMGIKDWGIFLEAEDVSESFGMNITFCVAAGSKEHSYALLQKLGMPFKKNDKDKR